MRNLFADPPTPDTMPATNDRELDLRLVTAAKRDIRDFAPLYTRYFDLVYRYCYHRLGHQEKAADATAQIFTKALAGLPRFRCDGASFRSWLFAIAHNELVDEARRYRETTNLESAGQLATKSPSPEDEYMSTEAKDELNLLLLHLTPDQRQVMELRLAGLTGPEIANAMGRSLASVKIAQSRAVSRMRENLVLTSPASREASSDR